MQISCVGIGGNNLCCFHQMRETGRAIQWAERNGHYSTPLEMSKQAASKHKANSNPDAVERRMWSARVLGKYWALQLPGTALLVVILHLLQDYLSISTWLLWSIVGFWVVKDVVLYPIVWRSYDPGYPATLHSLDGARGVATERLDPTGYVRVRGELWRAELVGGAPPVEKGEPVRVQTVRDFTLQVIPDDHRDQST